MTASPKKFLSILLLACLVLCLGLNPRARAQSDSFILEAEQNWPDTYGSGGTCIHGGHNLVVADVDEDGVKELITGGSSYNYLPDGSKTSRWAPLKIWSWNGKNITLEKSQSWPGNINCVFAEDVDGDGRTEIITAGRVAIDSGNSTSLQIWSWNGETIALRGTSNELDLFSFSAIGMYWSEKSGIVTVGRSFDGTKTVRHVSLWEFDGTDLTLARDIVDDGENACANSVCAYDLDNDGVSEIITAGYVNILTNSTGQLSVWQGDDTSFSLIENVEWRMTDGYGLDSAGGVQGNTLVSSVKVADVDGDSVPEIVTGGFTFDGTRIKGQLRIWNWSVGALKLEKSHEWENLDITEATSISIEDVDGDGKKEIVTSGYTAGYGSFALDAADKSKAELRVWNWDGSGLILEQSRDWIVETSVSAWNVGSGDLDNDGVVEMVTVGCMQTIDLLDCDPDLRIWSIALSSTSSPNPYLPIALVAVAAVAAAGTIILFLRKKNEKG